MSKTKKQKYSPGCAPSYIIEGIEQEKKLREAAAETLYAAHQLALAETKEENHTIMCLRAEITARNAANKVLREKVDYLEEGLRVAKEQVANLLRLNQLRHDAETDPASPGKGNSPV